MRRARIASITSLVLMVASVALACTPGVSPGGQAADRGSPRAGAANGTAAIERDRAPEFVLHVTASPTGAANATTAIERDWTPQFTLHLTDSRTGAANATPVTEHDRTHARVDGSVSAERVRVQVLHAVRGTPDAATDPGAADHDRVTADAPALLAAGHGRVQAANPDAPGPLRAERSSLRGLQSHHHAALGLIARVQRSSSVPRATGHRADRPTVVTRPLRGPPAAA